MRRFLVAIMLFVLSINCTDVLAEDWVFWRNIAAPTTSEDYKCKRRGNPQPQPPWEKCCPSCGENGGDNPGEGVGTICSLAFTINTGRMGPGTILPEGLISLKAQIPTPSIHTPQSIQYILGLMVSSISTNDLNTNGVPRRVTVLGPSCQPITYEFADNTSTGAPIGSYSASLNRLIMLDTNSAPTLSMPRYYVLKMTDLTEYLYGADSGKEDYKGLISFTLPYGRTASLLDGGIKGFGTKPTRLGRSAFQSAWWMS